jgi:DNA repair protein RecO (recombination protein O)
MRPVLQPGNAVRATWRARLDEHLGHYTVEGLTLRAGELMIAAHAAYGVTHLAALCRLLPERDPHELVHDALAQMLDHFDDRAVAAALVARFELQMLAELGFGLDLDRCAATGATAELIYVSPKSGRAVSREAGDPWRERMLALPAFLREEIPEGDAGHLSDAFALTGFFLERHVLQPRGLAMHDSRASFINAVLRGTNQAETIKA